MVALAIRVFLQGLVLTAQECCNNDSMQHPQSAEQQNMEQEHYWTRVRSKGLVALLPILSLST
eukprot:3410071-Amphidinium_carterae.1